MEAIRDAVEFAEGIMGLPLPVEHAVVVFDEDAVPAGYAGANYGFAFSYSPEYETRGRAPTSGESFNPVSSMSLPIITGAATTLR